MKLIRMFRVVFLLSLISGCAAVSTKDAAREPQATTASTSAPSLEKRNQYLRDAMAWERPKWISEDYEFADNFDVVAGPEKPKWFPFGPEDHLTCNYDAKHKVAGTSAKIYCFLPKEDNTQESIKIKYGVQNEVFGELTAAKLLWSLGFYSDRAFSVGSVTCNGCPSATKNMTGGAFSVSIKYGKNLESSPDQGWTWDELSQMSHPEIQNLDRDLLKLMAIFLGHGDNRAVQQKLECKKADKTTGTCLEPVLVIHDVGSTFGIGTAGRPFGRIGIGPDGKMSLKGWKQRVLWSNTNVENGKIQACLGKVSKGGSEALHNPLILDAAREKLGKLLTGFSSGAAGQKRVYDLFKSAKVELHGDSVDEWVKEFYKKVDELVKPSQQSAKCNQK